MDQDSTQRHDGRQSNALRPVRIKPNAGPAAPGSVLIAMGNTEVICAASVEESVPRWMRAQHVEGGWVTAEYSMLPYATAPRGRRESTTGKVSGRTMEIQRLIGRSLRAVIDLRTLGSRTVWVDCDVLRADGGTRTASITGAYIAMALALDPLVHTGTLEQNPLREEVAAVSVGVGNGQPVLDLDYIEDVGADVDMNVVMTGSGSFVEIQGTAEGAPFPESTLLELQRLARSGIEILVNRQREVIYAETQSASTVTQEQSQP